MYIELNCDGGYGGSGLRDLCSTNRFLITLHWNIEHFDQSVFFKFLFMLILRLIKV